jgi:hypothetical protein
MIQNKCVRLIMEYISLINIFGDINVNTIRYKFCQTWACLTITSHMIAFFLGQREYMIRCVIYRWQTLLVLLSILLNTIIMIYITCEVLTHSIDVQNPGPWVQNCTPPPLGVSRAGVLGCVCFPRAKV